MTATKPPLLIIITFTLLLSSQNLFAEEVSYYQINDVKMQIKDHATKWNSDKRKLEVIFTPSTLNGDEKKSMSENPVSFSLPPFKESPNVDIWQNYPYVQMTFLFTSEEISPDTIRAVSVNTFGVEGKGGNTFFSISKRNLKLEELSFDKSQLKMKMQGKKESLGDNYSWNLELR